MTNSKAYSIALIDSDILVYRCGFAAEKRRYVASFAGRSEVFESKRDAQAWLANARAAAAETGDAERVRVEDVANTSGSIVYEPVVEPVDHACQNCRTSISGILGALQLPESAAEFYLSGKDNFRKGLATLKEYKGNRKDVPKPVHYEALRDFITHRYRATVVDGQEADDAIGIRATELGGVGIIVSSDKDLKNIPGWHYDWTKKRLHHVTEREAISHFYCQLLSGDSTDNIPGIEGVGVTKAKRILKGLTSEKSLWHAVLAEYTKRYPDGYMGRDVKQALVELGQLLWIRRQPNEMWSPP